MTPIRYLLWDFDGTLYDTYPMMARQLLESLRINGAENLPAYQEAFDHMKVCLAHACQVYGQQYGIEPQLLFDTFHELQKKDSALIPFAGTAECLRSLREHGFRHYLYTHRGATAPDCLKADGLWQYFSDAVTREDGFPLKPAPDAILALLERNQIPAGEAAMVGDRDIDIDAGHNAGIAGILFDPGNYYPQQPAEYRVETMKELQELLLK